MIDMFREFSYFITLRKDGRRSKIIFNIGREDENVMLLRVGGKYSPIIFQNIISTLSKYGAVVSVKSSSKERKYAIREDLGPVVGAYLILIRRARKIEAWNTFFSRMISGEYPGIAKAFTAFLELAMDLSKFSNQRNEGGVLSPKILTALSASLKNFVRMMIRE